MLFKQGLDFIKTDKLWMHTWRSIVGLAAMYGFLCHCELKTIERYGFSYSSPIFIPLIAWLFLKKNYQIDDFCRCDWTHWGFICR